MRRRFALCALLTLLTAPLGAEPPPGKVMRIGALSAVTAEGDICIGPVRQGLQALGYVEGRNYKFEFRGAAGRMERLPALAAEIVELKPELIVVLSATAVEAVTKATSSLPIVMASSFYPIEMGFIASLARPGGNVTGETHFTPDLMAKRVQVLNDALPGLARIAVLRLPGRIHDLVVSDMTVAGAKLGIEVTPIEVKSSEDLSAAFETAAKARAEAVMSTQSPFFFENASRIAELALEHRLPSLSGEPNAPALGALLFYGPNVTEGCGRVGTYVDRVLNGVKPADLPVEQPTRIRLVINLKTAKALGLNVPQSLLARADEVIE